MKLFLLAVVLAAGGCRSEAENTVNAEYEKAKFDHAKAWLEADSAAARVCLKRGGVPIQSSWDGRIKDCK